MTDEDVIDEIEERHAGLAGEGSDAIFRARAVGARGPLTFVGAGMFGIVLCDDRGNAYKVGRIGRHEDDREAASSFARSNIGDEGEWLQAAAQVPEVAPHVARFVAWYPNRIVLVRECVAGRPGRWADESKLFDLHQRIRKAMIPHGWGSPEFKADSYVNRESDGVPILVDASMALRFGHGLLAYARDIVSGRRRDHDPA